MLLCCYNFLSFIQRRIHWGVLILYATERIPESAIRVMIIDNSTSNRVKVREIGVRGQRRRSPVISGRPLIGVLTIIPTPVTGKGELQSTYQSIVYIYLGTGSKSRCTIYYSIKFSPLSGTIISSSGWYMVSSCTWSLIIPSIESIPSSCWINSS